MVSNACAFDKALSLRDFGLVRTRSPGIRITTHVEVIMVNVDDFYTLVVFERIWNRPSVDRAFFEVHGALVVCVVQLSEADQGDESWIVDVVGDLLFTIRTLFRCFSCKNGTPPRIGRARSKA